LIRSPSSISVAGSAVLAVITLSTAATSTPTTLESMIVPGATKSAASIATPSAIPAKRTVCPALSVAVWAAKRTSWPVASSSRKRDTSKSE